MRIIIDVSPQDNCVLYVNKNKIIKNNSLLEAVVFLRKNWSNINLIHINLYNFINQDDKENVIRNFEEFYDKLIVSNLNRRELGLIHYSKKDKHINGQLLIDVLEDKINFYIIKGIFQKRIESINFFLPPLFSSYDKHINMKINSKFDKLLFYNTSILEGKKLTLNKMVNGLFINDYVAKSLFFDIERKFNKVLNRLIKEYKFNKVIIFHIISRKIDNEIKRSIVHDENIKVSFQQLNRKTNVKLIEGYFGGKYVVL